MKRKIVSGIILTLMLIGMLILALNVQPVHAPATPIPGGVDGEHYYQRHLWYAAGRWWIFYSDTTDAIYTSSVNGVSGWVGETLQSGITYTQRIDAYYNGSHFFVVTGYHDPDRHLWFRQGQPQTDGTITWDAAWQDLGNFGSAYVTEVSVTADSKGYPWILANRETETILTVTTSTSKSGVWSTRSGFPQTLTSGNNVAGSIMSLTNRRLYFIYKKVPGAGGLYGKYWDNSSFWSEETILSGELDAYKFNAIPIGDDVHLTYRNETDGRAYYKKRSFAEWSSSVDVSNASIVNTPSIIRREDAEFWILWGDSDAKIWARCYNGTTWMPVRQVATEPVYSGGEARFEITTEAPPKCGLLFYGSSLYFDVFDLARTIPGDVNSDGIVNIIDIVIGALAFGSKPGDPNWNPIADLNQDGVVDIFDLVMIAIHFGETW